MTDALAFRLADLADQGPFGRTKLFELVKRGVLPARKIEGTTFVLKADWRHFLETAPLAVEARRPDRDRPLSRAA